LAALAITESCAHAVSLSAIQMTRPLNIAIFGLAGCYAGADDARAFWQNILDKADSVADAGPEWTGPYFEANTTANDRTYTSKGGFLRGLAEVDPMEVGVLPSIAKGGDAPSIVMPKEHIFFLYKRSR